MDLDSKSDLEKRLKGMTPAQQMREFVFVLDDLRRDIAEMRTWIAEVKNKLEKSGGL